MGYYYCPTEELLAEAERRGLSPWAHTRDILSEILLRDDRERLSDAYTVETEVPDVTPLYQQKPTVEFGKTVPTETLVNQRITSWNLNGLFPTMQLFFDSGLSCTIEGLSDAKINLDPELRFRLTDLTYQEEGRLTNSILPNLGRKNRGILIKEATLAHRKSITIAPQKVDLTRIPLGAPTETITREVHIVVGLKLEGMNKMGYIWAWKMEPKRGCSYVRWCNVRLAGLRDDVPESCLGYPLDTLRPGQEVKLYSRFAPNRTPLPKEEDSDWKRFLKSEMALDMVQGASNDVVSMYLSDDEQFGIEHTGI